MKLIMHRPALGPSKPRANKTRALVRTVLQPDSPLSWLMACVAILNSGSFSFVYIRNFTSENILVA